MWRRISVFTGIVRFSYTHQWADTGEDSDAQELARVDDDKPKPVYFRFIKWRERGGS